MGNTQPDYYDQQQYHQPEIDYQSFSQFEIYKIDIPNDLAYFYHTWYDERLNRNTRFVRIIDFNPESKTCDTCSTSEHLTVYTERLFFLDHLILSYPQAIFFMKEVLITLDQLYDQFGVFEVTPRMIGVNHKGKVKVWCNQNFAQNLPIQQRDPYLDEQDIVYDIVDMIQQATEDYRFTRTIESYAGNLTFKNTIKVLDLMQSKEGLAVNKIFLNLKEYQNEMYKAIQAKNQQQQKQAAEAVVHTYYQVPKVTYDIPQVQTYQVYEYPEVYIHQTPAAPIPSVNYQSVVPLNTTHNTYSFSDPYSQNGYSVLKLYQPPPVQTQPQQYHQPQGIQRRNKQQRVMAPQKIRSPQINVVNRPTAQKLPVTEFDVKRLEADMRRKQNQIKLKRKLQENYNQIPQVQSMIVVVQQDDRMKRHADKKSISKNMANPRQMQVPSQQNIGAGRPNNIQKYPMHLQQMNYQSQIFTLF